MIEALAYCLENGKAKAFEPIADELFRIDWTGSTSGWLI
jgi:hypothetical protein